MFKTDEVHRIIVKLFISVCILGTHNLYLFQCVGPNRDKSFVRNKAAQMFALACTVDYPQFWPTFFNDLQQTLHLGEIAVDIYLRILKAIDSEVVDREITHTPEVKCSMMFIYSNVTFFFYIFH